MFQWAGGLNASFEVFSHRKIPYIVYDKGIQGQKSICVRAKYEAMLSWFPACYRLGTTPPSRHEQSRLVLIQPRVQHDLFAFLSQSPLGFLNQPFALLKQKRQTKKKTPASCQPQTSDQDEEWHNGWKWSECKADWWKFENCWSSGTSQLTFKISVKFSTCTLPHQTFIFFLCKQPKNSCRASLSNSILRERAAFCFKAVQSRGCHHELSKNMELMFGKHTETYSLIYLW